MFVASFMLCEWTNSLIVLAIEDVMKRRHAESPRSCPSGDFCSLSSSMQTTIFRATITYCALLIEASWFVHLARRYANETARLFDQLGAFSVKDSLCFCCSVEHRDPTTNAPVPCDRRLVNDAIERWFGNLDSFDKYVQHDVKEGCAVQQSLSYRFAVLSSTAGMWADIGQAVWHMWADKDQEALRVVHTSLRSCLFIRPLLLVVIFRIAKETARHCRHMDWWVQRLSLRILLAATTALIITGLRHGIPALVSRISNDTLSAPAISWLYLVPLTLAGYGNRAWAFWTPLLQGGLRKAPAPTRRGSFSESATTSYQTEPVSMVSRSLPDDGLPESDRR
eukprot:TRINITY_DN3213_c0_g1_i1.p1 TRINITY_DN3213_c0_g1~~TRINITY_DN3213_c0_g1_i1.p1  ORF type:complete len:337 (+),score=41.79 TRINITY_DN3213_c0_g1_i1:347-1357(+)